MIPRSKKMVSVLVVLSVGGLGAGSINVACGQCQEIPADFDGDGYVDRDDCAIFRACLTGSMVLYDPQALPPGCALTPHSNVIPADFDSDGDVDQEDFGVLQQSLGVVSKLPAGQLAYYRLDGSATDCSIYANDGTGSGVNWDTDRKVGTHSARFDGFNDYISVPGGQGTAIDLHGDSFSIAFWVKFRQIGAANADGQRILKKGDASRYELYVGYASGPEPLLFFTIDDGVSQSEITHSAAQSATVFSGDWVHITVSRDAMNDILKYHINGTNIATMTGVTMGDISSPDHNLMIGTNQNADGNWFDGALDDLRIYNRALGPEQINAVYAVGAALASVPNPATGATGVGLGADLSWTAGLGAESHDVYFGTNEQAVASADHGAPEYKGNQPAANTTYDPGLLGINVTYYWRIDELDASQNTYTGNVWRFTTVKRTALLVRPANGAQSVDPHANLVWTAGAIGGPYTHDVYLGISQQAVANATHGSPEYQGNQAGTTYDPNLELDTTYYWRIDEVNPPDTWPGEVWSLTTCRFGGPMNGVNYVWGTNGSYGGSKSDQSLASARDAGCNWIMINAFWFQDTLTSTLIYPDYDDYYSAAPESVGHAIDRCHALGMQIILRPVVDIKTGEHKGNIVPTDAWFDSFRDFMDFWANVAQGYQGHDPADMICLCAELDSTCTPTWALRWHDVIANVRSRFDGPLTYGGNAWDYQSVPWWNLLDYIGIEAYWGLTSDMDPTLAQLKDAWNSRADSIQTWRNNNYPDTKIIFTEVGYQSRDGTNITPGGTPRDRPLDLQEQADCYEALLSELQDRDWWMGVFWWYWDVKPEEGGPTNTNWTPRGKPAQQVMEDYYQ